MSVELGHLNKCFDDIEFFVSILPAEYQQHMLMAMQLPIGGTGGSLKSILSSSENHNTSKSSSNSANKAKQRALLPNKSEYVDIFQKFKYSFNLLAKLKAHIHDPNAPELVHYLFEPLALIQRSAAETRELRELSKTIWVPLMSGEARELLLNCLSSKEHMFWMSLGDAWTLTHEEVSAKPHVYGHLEKKAAAYRPLFNEMRVAATLAAAAAKTSLKLQQQHQQQQQQPVSGSRAQQRSETHGNEMQVQQQQQQQKIDQAQLNAQSLTVQPSSIRSLSRRNQREATSVVPLASTATTSESAATTTSKTTRIRNYDEMQRWATDLTYRGAK